MDGVQALLDSLEKLAKDKAAAASQQRDDVSNALHAGLAQASSQLHQVRNELAGQLRSGAKSVNDFVQERPWTSVGIAAGAALLVGMALARRN
ncbi:MAG TPA: hypothetical protein VF848_09755 [Steroidobacteraceae bacterium]